MRKFLLTIFVLGFTCLLQAQHTGLKERRKKLVQAVDKILQDRVDSNDIPGAVILIKEGNRVIDKKAFGFAQKFDDSSRLLPAPEKMTTEHLFDIASLTKVVGTSTAIMLLTDRGLLHPDDPVGKFIPAFNAADKKSITLRHLLTHTAGLYEWYPMYYRSSGKEQTFQLIGGLPLKYPVGQQRKYSDLGFTVLGEVIEKVSGRSLDSFLLQEVFMPLGMMHTLYNPLKAGGYDRIAATSHGNPYEYRMVHDSSLGFVFKEINPDQWNGWRHYTLRGEVNDGNAWYANGGVSGAAGIFSTIDDLQLLVDMLLHKGVGKNGRFLSEKTIDLFLSQDAFKNGLGWMMDPANSFMKNAPAGSFGHTGFTGTSIAAVPAKKISVILLINRQNRGLLPSGEYYNVNPIRLRVWEAVMNYLDVK